MSRDLSIQDPSVKDLVRDSLCFVSSVYNAGQIPKRKDEDVNSVFPNAKRKMKVAGFYSDKDSTVPKSFWMESGRVLRDASSTSSSSTPDAQCAVIHFAVDSSKFAFKKTNEFIKVTMAFIRHTGDGVPKSKLRFDFNVDDFNQVFSLDNDTPQESDMKLMTSNNVGYWMVSRGRPKRGRNVYTISAFLSSRLSRDLLSTIEVILRDETKEIESFIASSDPSSVDINGLCEFYNYTPLDLRRTCMMLMTTKSLTYGEAQHSVVYNSLAGKFNALSISEKVKRIRRAVSSNAQKSAYGVLYGRPSEFIEDVSMITRHADPLAARLNDAIVCIEFLIAYYAASWANLVPNPSYFNNKRALFSFDGEPAQRQQSIPTQSPQTPPSFTRTSSTTTPPTIRTLELQTSDTSPEPRIVAYEDPVDSERMVDVIHSAYTVTMNAPGVVSHTFKNVDGRERVMYYINEFRRIRAMDTSHSKPYYKDYGKRKQFIQPFTTVQSIHPILSLKKEILFDSEADD